MIDYFIAIIREVGPKSESRWKVGHDIKQVEKHWTKVNLQKTSTSTVTVETPITIKSYPTATIETWPVKNEMPATQTENSLKT